MEKSEKIAIIHHWDSDGIASSTIITNMLKRKEFFFYIPKIGVYNIESIDINRLRDLSPSTILILDYGISTKELSKLKDILDVNIAIIDHHVNNIVDNITLCNPIAFGYSGSSYPSTTWVIKELLRVEDLDDIIALGLLGDLGKSIISHKLNEWILKICQKHNLALSELFEAVNIIDSCYKLIDEDCINYARNTLIKQGVKGVLNNEFLKNKFETLKMVVDYALKNVDLIKDYGVIKLFELSNDYYITSHIGREIAYRFKNNVIILKHFIQKLDLTYIYVRSYKYRLRNILEKLRHEGLHVGGKDYVFVVTCNNNCYEELDLILKVLMKHLGGYS